MLTPSLSSLIDRAASTILRRPIKVEGDEYWKEFSKNVDGIGSSLNEYAKQLAVAGIRDGHSAILVDSPRDEQSKTLLDKRMLDSRPYFIKVEAEQILGWRQKTTASYSPLENVRILELVQDLDDPWNEMLVQQVRVIYPGRYELHKANLEEPQGGTFDMDQIPLVPFYTNRLGLLLSHPPLIDIARLNLAHYRAQADRQFALHLAAMQKLILEMNEGSKAEPLGVNYAFRMDLGSKAYWLKADNGSFDAQKQICDDLYEQMSTLGVTKLLNTKLTAESSDSKRIDLEQANSALAMISMELEAALQRAFDMAAKYAGREAPVISLDREFGFSHLLGQDVSVLGTLNEKGQLPDNVFLEILKMGGILPDSVDTDRVANEIKTAKAAIRKEAMQNPQLGSAGGNGPGRPGQVRRSDPRTIRNN